MSESKLHVIPAATITHTTAIIRGETACDVTVYHARTTLAIEWTRRPAYSVLTQSGANKTRTATIHWVDLHCGPITFQIRDQAGLHSILELLTRTHRTAVAVFLDGPDHAADPTDPDYQAQLPPQVTA
jgi:hypothetical protein